MMEWPIRQQSVFVLGRLVVDRRLRGSLDSNHGLLLEIRREFHKKDRLFWPYIFNPDPAFA